MKRKSNWNQAVLVTEDPLREFLMVYLLKSYGFKQIRTYRIADFKYASVKVLRPDVLIHFVSEDAGIFAGLRLRTMGCSVPMIVIADSTSLAADLRARLPGVHYLDPSFTPDAFKAALEAAILDPSACTDNQERNHAVGGADMSLTKVHEPPVVTLLLSGGLRRDVNVRSVWYFFYDEGAVFVRSAEGVYAADAPWQEVSMRYGTEFVNVHRHYWVNPAFVQAQHVLDHELLIGTDWVPLDRSYRHKLMESLMLMGVGLG
jgi:DNA-binding LytR/AlgR family response regulator